ncbi:MAG: DNA recombination protein RmuC [Armatimonadia bacterium]
MEAVIAVISLILGLVVGLVTGLQLRGRTEQARRQDLENRLTEAQVAAAQHEERVLNLEREAAGLNARLEERDKLQAVEQELSEKMRQAFADLSQTAISRNSEEFLRLAQQRFESLSKAAEGTLATKEQAIKGMVDPLAELLGKYELALKDMELRRQTAYASLDERLKALAEAESGLQRETNRLVSALRRPEVRGHWGEMQLRNAVELAGMSEYCDFTEQEHLEVGSGAQRPDMIIRLPGNRSIVVDAKVPLNAYLDALECEDLEARQRLYQDHARQCRTHLDGLAAKRYWEKVENSPDCVVMFIPGESLFAAAVEADPDLIARGWLNKVIVATPSTFIALLYAVSYGWQQQTFAENAREVRDLASQLYDRLRVFAGHFGSVGTNLDRSIDAYNKAVGSLERQLLVSARKLKDMGVTGKEDLPELKPVDTMARQMGSELAPGLPAAEEAAGD